MTIAFNIPTSEATTEGGVSWWKIKPASLLPSIYATVTIDGTTQPTTDAYNNPYGPVIEIDCTNSAPAGLFITGTDNCVIKGLALNRGANSAITLSGSSNNVITGCYIGTTVTGSAAAANNYGIILQHEGSDNSHDNIIGGTTEAERNVISGNTLFGIYIHDTGSDSNEVIGNYIGTTASGEAGLGNGNIGIILGSGPQYNIIGGAASGEGNVISGNNFSGVYISSSGTGSNEVLGNYIGINRSGSAAIPNGYGVRIESAAKYNSIGNGIAGGGNVISGNGGDGIVISDAGTDGNQILGNYIGTDSTGTVSLNNHYGILIDAGASNNIIGGSSTGEGNLISGNNQSDSQGIWISNSNSNKVYGNFIGTDVTGKVPLANSVGMQISSSAKYNQVGGAGGEANLISGNTYDGIQIRDAGTNSNEVYGNLIGLNVDGDTALANGTYGIHVYNGASYNLIGGDSTLEGNYISGNSMNGIYIDGYLTGVSPLYNLVRNNYIGLNKALSGKIANHADGIYLHDCGENYIGAINYNGNNIAGNMGRGVDLVGCNNVKIVQNVIGSVYPGFPAGLGNEGGVCISASSTNNIVGGETSFEANIIVGNTAGGEPGIYITDAGTSANYIKGNYIGIVPPLGGGSPIALGNHIGIWIRNAASGNVIGGLAPDAWNQIGTNEADGICIDGSASNEVYGDNIGLATFGNGNDFACPNGVFGINITNGSNYNVIGTSEIASAARNVISNNSIAGIYIGNDCQYNALIGNFIGTSSSGEAAEPNINAGVYIEGGKHNKIGDGQGGMNLISGNSQEGIVLAGPGTDSNEIKGNYIGTDLSGMNILYNGDNGISISNSPLGGPRYNQIGDGTTGGRNIISGNGNDPGNNGEGIVINGPGCDSNEVTGNYIGTKKNGTDALANGDCGIQISGGARYNKIGNGAGGRNIISGNTSHGVLMFIPGTDFNEIKGNYIGTDKDGTAALANGAIGVAILLGPQGSRIGDAAGGGNVISGNGTGGVAIAISSTNSNEVLGNKIGPDKNGTALLTGGSNPGFGVAIAVGASYNQIGDGTPGGRNIISGNGGPGMLFVDFIDPNYGTVETKGNIIKGNSIGTDAGGTINLGNPGGGISVSSTASGETANIFGLGNIIAFNGNFGVSLEGVLTTSETITQNSIFSNLGKGISLINGANQNIPSPEVTKSVYDNVAQAMHATGTASVGAAVELFGAEQGQGKVYVGTATADASGSWEGTFYGLTGVPTDAAVTATQTDVQGNTSEFSPTREVTFHHFLHFAPDLMIGTLESGADYERLNYFETVPVVQVKRSTVASNETAVYYFKYRNSGDTSDFIRGTAEAGSSPFTVKYFGSKQGTDEITSIVTGGGLYEFVFPGATFEGRVEMSYTGNTLATKEITMTVVSTVDVATKDVIAAVTTFVPIPPPVSLVDHFGVQAPAHAVAGQTFTATVTAYNAAGGIEPNVTGTTYLTVDDGLVTPESLDASWFHSGVASGDMSLSKVGLRRVTALNGMAAGTVEVLVYNASREYSSVELGIPGMTISLPEGATTQDVTVTASLVTSPGDAPPGYYLGGNVFDILPNGTTFLEPVTVTIPISGPLAAPHVYYWNGTSWSTDGIMVISYTDTSLTFTTTHFTPFGPMAAAAGNLIRFGPNPYNPNSGTNAHIWYWLNANAETSVYIIDLAGTVVWKQTYAAGTNGGQKNENNIAFDGKSAWGDALGNGVYLYKIVQGGKSIGGGKIAIIK